MKDRETTHQQTQKTNFEIAIEQKVGESIETIRDMPIDERRQKIEKKYAGPMQFYSSFPFIGRAHTSTISHAEIEKLVDEALK